MKFEDFDFDNLDNEKNWEVVVTNYKDYRKIVCACIKRENSYVKTDEDVENFIDGEEGIIRASFNMNKKDFAEGKYVLSIASVTATNLD